MRPLLRPFEVAADRVSRPFRDAYGYFAGLVHAKSENNRLRVENEQLRQQASQNAFAASENADLRKKLGFINSPQYPRGFGHVTASDPGQVPSAFEQQVLIDAGSSSGIHVFDPVVTGEGLVGTVVRVAHNQSLVALLTDDTTSVSAVDVETGAQGSSRPAPASIRSARTESEKRRHSRHGRLEDEGRPGSARSTRAESRSDG